jgi:hypothetical protein
MIFIDWQNLGKNPELTEELAGKDKCDLTILL